MPYLKVVQFLKIQVCLTVLKLREKSLIHLFSQFTCYLPGTNQVTGSEEQKRQQEEILCYLAQNKKSRVGWYIHYIWLTGSPINKIYSSYPKSL